MTAASPQVPPPSPGPSTPAGTPGVPTPVRIFTAGTDGYHTFRIPALVTATDGSLLAFAEGRRTGTGDAGPIDLVLRRSHDGGLTWGPLQCVGSGGDHTVGNPCPVRDPGSGDVVLLTTRAAGWATEARILRGEVSPEDGRRVWTQRSTDNGASWSAPVEITADVKRPDWRWYATGPGHAIALRHGPHAGRLVAPANHSTADGYAGHLLLSDDGGHSWRIGALDPCTDGTVRANETTVTELPDGTIYANTRNERGHAPASRAQTVSSTAGETFDQPYQPVPDLVTPVVQGSVTAVGDVLVFAGPSEPGERRRLALRLSRDAGRTWGPPVVLWPGPAAYSDLAVLDSGGLAVLFEYGVDRAYEGIGFVHLPAPHHGGPAAATGAVLPG